MDTQVVMDVQAFLASYVLTPILCAVGVFMVAMLNKKNEELANGKFIFWIFLTGIALALPGSLGFLNIDFMSLGFIICQLYYFVIGVLLTYIMVRNIPETFTRKKGIILFALSVTLGLAVFFFQLLFNWLSNLAIGLFIAPAMVAFLLPLLFWWTYQALLRIPIEIYKVWKHPDQQQAICLDALDFDKVLILELELSKTINATETLRVKVKAPENMNFGLWFNKFVDDYNVKFPVEPIEYADAEQVKYGWIFYMKTTFFRRNQVIDPDHDIKSNHLKEKCTVFAKRVTDNVGVANLTYDTSFFYQL